FLLRNRRIALEPLGVDDRVIETGLRAVVQGDRIGDLGPGRGRAERRGGDAEDRLALRKARLDGADALDRLDGGADVVDVAGTDRKDEGVEDQVAGRQGVLARDEVVATVR